MTHYFVNRIDYSPHVPIACMNCGKEPLVDNAVKALTGPDPSNLTPKENHLCLYCETLMIITTESKKALSIQPSLGNTVTLRSSKK